MSVRASQRGTSEERNTLSDERSREEAVALSVRASQRGTSEERNTLSDERSREEAVA